MNLEGFLQLARLAEHLKINLWQSNDKRLLKAVLFLEPYHDSSKKWPHKQIKKVSDGSLYPVLKLAALYRNDRIDKAVKQLEKKVGLNIFLY